MSLPRTDTLGRRRTDDIEFTFSPCVCAFQPKHAVSYLPLHVVPRSHPGKPRRPYSTHSLCSAVCAGGGQTVGAGRWLRRTNAPFPSPPSSPCVLCHVVIVTLLRPSTRPSYCVLALPVVSFLFPPFIHTTVTRTRLASHPFHVFRDGSLTVFPWQCHRGLLCGWLGAPWWCQDFARHPGMEMFLSVGTRGAEMSSLALVSTPPVILVVVWTSRARSWHAHEVARNIMVKICFSIKRP